MGVFVYWIRFVWQPCTIRKYHSN